MSDDRTDRPLTTAVIAGTEAPPEPPAQAPSTALVPRSPLLASEMLDEMRGRWMDIQSRFVDEPRKAVEQADGLVAEVMKRLAEVFAKERDGLEKQWGRNEEVSTENLRIALQRYRSFFDRLLDV